MRALSAPFRLKVRGDDIDSNPDETRNTEEARKLLYHLALLEYNSYWWRSHPAVRTLPGYCECRPTKEASYGTDQASGE
jgi:hypothetical protein